MSGDIRTIHVRPQKTPECVRERADGSYEIWVSVPAREGKANERALALLARHLRVPQAAIVFMSGLRSRHKRIVVSKSDRSARS